MYLVVEGAVVARSATPWTNKKGEKVTFYSVSLSDRGQLCKLDCSKDVFDGADKLLLKTGVYHVDIAVREFQGRSTLSVTAITPAAK